MEFKKGVLYRVEWLDSYGVGQQWTPLDDQHLSPTTIFSVGRITLETDDCIEITPHFTTGEDPEGCGQMAIPKCSIISSAALSFDPEA